MGSYKQTGRYKRRGITMDRQAKVRALMGSREDDSYWNQKVWYDEEEEFYYVSDNNDENTVLDEELDDETLKGDD